MVHPNSDRVPRVPPYSGHVLEASTFQIRGYHPLWRLFPKPSSKLKLCNSMDAYRYVPNTPSTPQMQRPVPWHIHGLGSSAFAHHYLRNRFYFLLLQVLRCFTSLRSPLQTIFSPADDAVLSAPGFPIRTSPDHRLFAPNRSFSQLTTSFFAFCDLGIPRVLLVA
jgi:hypothetical protein